MQEICKDQTLSTSFTALKLSAAMIVYLKHFRWKIGIATPRRFFRFSASIGARLIIRNGR